MFLSKNPDEQVASSPYFPLGLLYLAGYVRDQGHDVAIFDATFAEDESAFLEALRRETPDVVGISTLLPTRDMALTLAQMAHERDAVVVVGGPDPTQSPGLYAAHPAVDIVVHHEGEQTLAALLALVDAEQLTLDALRDEPGLAFRAGGQLVVNEPRPPIENLDTLPLPARDLIDLDRYLNAWQEMNGYSSITISTARGCPYACNWCRDSVHGNGFRQRSPENVAAEVKLLKEAYRVDRLRVVDDVDGFTLEWLEAWKESAISIDGVIPFEGLNELTRQDIPMLDVRDSL
jgi:radical SAM superfamily enzyme YgiQ (UPF0313 family)